jgi:ATP-dependent exoDNAse (exonuclease V) alpha subunit
MSNNQQQPNNRTAKLKPIPEYQHILDKLNQGTQAIFITGKAGTGKSVLIEQLVKALPNCLVTATTAMAATNIRGTTLHSLFGLKPNDIDPTKEFNRRKDKHQQLRAMEVLIIDEVSMLTPNIVDIIDNILQRSRNSTQPFGGLKVIFVGDLLQLPPIIGNEIKEFFYSIYNLPYFFVAEVFHKLPLYSIELTKVWRQQDGNFIELLNSIRTKNQNIFSAVKFINNECYKAKKPLISEQLHLVTTNKKAIEINNSKLSELGSDVMEFSCDIDGDIDAKKLGFAELLTLKKQAKVIFTKNTDDFYNGEQGEVVGFAKEYIKVKKASNGKIVKVYQETWEQYKTVYDKEKKQLTQEHLGSVSQFPLILGWAITVHKSQGMSLDNVVIDTKPAFTNGLVYVALSRCRTLTGISLLNKLSLNDIKADSNLIDWHQQFVTRLTISKSTDTIV